MIFSETISLNITKHHCSERVIATSCEYRSVKKSSLWRISTFRHLSTGLSKCQMVYHTSKQTKPTWSYSVAQNYETVRDTSLLYTLSHCVHIRLIPETTARCIPGPACAGINSVCILLERDVHQWTCTQVFWLNVHSVCSNLASLMTWLNT